MAAAASSSSSSPPPPSPSARQQLLQRRRRSTEVSCDSSGDSGSVTVRIHGVRGPPPQQPRPEPLGPGKASVSSSGSSSGDSGARAREAAPVAPGGGSSGRRGGLGRKRGRGTGGGGGFGLGLGLGLGSRRKVTRLPQLFERASPKWWNPKFDSSNLEEACLEHCFPRTRRLFRYALSYLGAAGLLWGGYLALRLRPRGGGRLAPFVASAVAFVAACLAFFLFTFTRAYGRHPVRTSLTLTGLVFALTLAPQFQALGAPAAEAANGNASASPSGPCLSQVGSFSMCIEALLLLYTVMHLPLYLSLLLGLSYSVLFETVGYYFREESCFAPFGDRLVSWDLLSKALLHVCIHATGIHLFIMSEVRSRSTFLKAGQSIMHGKDLEVEKALKERMIHSVMPRIIADDLMKQGDDESENSVKRHSTSSPKNKKKKPSIQKTPIIFRPFKMQQIEPVSILFADIVGFTKMSANKSAHALVGLLNDLFGRFDRLCEDTKCEKISTLGDCYYCVAGCPEPREDHAYCCIEMGLGMIKAIEQFCQEKKEMVNMRVGVHTGTVLCGILGMRRFKFDVWSNDVNLANLMEQLGVAGKVHISEATAKYLDDRYEMEDGNVTERVGQSVVVDQLKGLKTYLIPGLKVKEPHCSCSQMLLAGLEAGDRSKLQGTSSAENVGNLAKGFRQLEKNKTCLSCNITFVPACAPSIEEGAIQNGCQDEHKNSRKSLGGCSPKSQNGLLSPPQEEKLSNSQTSLYEMLQEKGRWVGVSLDQSALLPLRFKNIREKTDAHFVDVIKEDSLMKDYFFNPPINNLSLNFLDQDLEMSYRSSYQEEVIRNTPVKTFASASFSSLLDVLLSTTVFLILSVTCFLKHGMDASPPPPAAVVVVVIAILLEVLSLTVSIRMVFFLEDVMACTKRLLEAIAGWLPRHFIGAILISLPAVAVFSHFTSEFETNIYYTMFMCSAILITIVQYCNFCQLSFWMRSSLATLVGGVLLVLLYVSPCPDSVEESHLYSVKNISFMEIFTSVQNISSREISHLQLAHNYSSVKNPCYRSTLDDYQRPADLICHEVFLGFILLLLLVWFLNREFEVNYRLHYHGDVEADLHRTKIQSMRDQADWLLRNIIPYHVAEQLKVSQSYSKNHDSGGVIFASIVNFSEFYEENYEGGKECYRVLNELIGDFDELLSKPDYSSIEKIKTIGATYMAASGLNTSQCQDSNNPHSHLQTLFEFAKEMMRVVDDFNNNMLWFNFKLRIGFNHGPLTAGVIGTTKLLYDIWGDTVNIASRMDTTGVECRIQVSEESYRILNKMGYDFDYRGTVNVKGKGQMKTFLYPKCMDNGIVPHHQLSISPDIRVQVDGSIGRSPTDEITNLVPSVQNSDKMPRVSVPNSELKDGLSCFKKLPKDLVESDDRRRFGKPIEKNDCESVGPDETNELTKLNNSRSV
ncbi:adenylate cyclase type 9 isoform X2 [Rhineura floridana]|uniref:adenylate cyclase type 9 isoform X2 n=1 Tax=Rhineura floridana TaxID=261503 RepID=UPI002AC83601|nr:adenylate cyclase type 9 isoform X2 [Rhineura floridana]